MKYSEEQRKEIKDIEATAKTVGEPFQVKCFEVLLNHWVNSSGLAQYEPKGDDTKDDHGVQSQHNLGVLPGALRAFLRKHKIPEINLGYILDKDENGDVKFIVGSPADSTAGQVVDCALLSAISNAIATQSFTVDPKVVLAVCKDQDCYTNHFWKILKQEKNQSFFSGLLEAKGKPKKLKPDGQAALADLIRQMAGDES